MPMTRDTYEPSAGLRAGRIAGAVAAAGVGLLTLTIVLGSWYKIDQGERGVILRNGRYVETVNPGLGFKWPLVDHVEKMPIQTTTFTWKGMESYSHDQQPAHLLVSVTLHPNAERMSDIYARFGSVDNAVNKMLSPVVNARTKVVFGGFTAANAVQKRGDLNQKVADDITQHLGNVADLLSIESVQIEDLGYSPAYLQSIEQRMLAEVQVDQVRQNAEREVQTAKITVTQANAKADSELAIATANAKAIKLRGDAEAAAIRARAEALGQNPLLVSLTQAERWNGVLPTTMLPGGSVPMINVSK